LLFLSVCTVPWSIAIELVSHFNYMMAPSGPQILPPSHGCPVNILPDELLACIFEAGTQEQDEGEDDESSDEWETDEEEEGEDAEQLVKNTKAEDADAEVIDEDGHPPMPPLLPPFQVLVSHVCKKWNGRHVMR
jgi:hypothetical protein